MSNSALWRVLLYIDVFLCEHMNRCVFVQLWCVIRCVCADKTTFIELETVLLFFLGLLNGTQWRCQCNKKKKARKAIETPPQCSARVQIAAQFYGLNVNCLWRRKQMCERAARSVGSSDRWRTRCMNVNDFLSESASQTPHQYWRNVMCFVATNSLVTKCGLQ